MTADSHLAGRRCPSCRETKSLDEFVRNRGTKDGRGAYCRPCHNTRMKEIAERLYGGNKNFLLQRRYGLTRVQLDEMIAAQGGLCAICEERPAKHVDHDHTTGKVRAVLCFQCNRGLGKFREELPTFDRAAQYLIRYSSQTKPPHPA